MPPEAPATPLRSIHVRRLRVLAGAAIFVAVAMCVYWASPWLLPLSIAEGPLLQQPGPTSVRVVWYLSRPDECSFRISSPARITAAHAGRRWSVLVEGLAPGREYTYEILDGERVLSAHSLRTPGTAPTPFSFAVFGDSGKGTRQQFLLAGQMARAGPDFLVHTGDIVYPDGSRRRYRRRFFDPYRELLPKAAIWPCLGNHDVSEPGAAAYHEIFELPANGPGGRPPEENYWFDYGSARFIVFNSNLSEADLSAQVAPWIADCLRDAPLWRFAVFHHPPYTAGSHDPDLAIQRVIVPLLERGQVDVVFNGHDHMYQRTLPLVDGRPAEDAAAARGRDAALLAPSASGTPGVVYIVSGAGGAKLYDLLPESQRPSYFAALNNQVHSFTLVKIDGAALRLQQIDLNGEVIDEYVIDKSRPTASQP